MRKTSTPSVHLQGLEPWTPWLRVRCSTNWARGACAIQLMSLFLEDVAYYIPVVWKMQPLFLFFVSGSFFLFSVNFINWVNQIFIFVPNTWSDKAYVTKMCFVNTRKHVLALNCVRLIHRSFPHAASLHLSEKLTYTRIYPHYPPKQSKKGPDFTSSEQGTTVLFIM